MYYLDNLEPNLIVLTTSNTADSLEMRFKNIQSNNSYIVNINEMSGNTRFVSFYLTYISSNAGDNQYSINEYGEFDVEIYKIIDNVKTYCKTCLFLILPEIIQNDFYESNKTNFTYERSK